MDLLERIKRPVVEGVQLSLPSGERMEGMLCTTAFHFIFSTRRKNEEEVTVLHTGLLSVERRPPSTGTMAIVVLKDLRRFSLEFASAEECGDVIESLEHLSSPDRLDSLHMFHSRPRVSSETSSPQLEDIAAMFLHWNCPPERWRISSCNKELKLCSSYPGRAIVPAQVTDEDIKIVAAYRYLSRFPSVCFYHTVNQAVLVRCGQPLCGPNQKRCREDVHMLNHCLQSRGKGRVVDCRSVEQTKQHAGKGGGTEIPSLYPQWKLEHAGLDSIQGLQASFNKLLEVCSDVSLWTSTAWFSRLEATGWLGQVEKLLRTVKSVVFYVHQEGSSVVVHGLDGRDAALQVTSLATLLMDSHSRTITGFLALIQREWLDAGHPFSLRHGHVASVPEKDRSPVFLLFLDAVWQIIQQFPLSFEFNERLLHLLFVHSYSSSFGTFLYDTPAERLRVKLVERTESLWKYALSPSVHPALVNPLYERNLAVLHITSHPCSISLWKQVYLRTDLSSTLTLPGLAAVQKLRDKNQLLRLELSQVRRDLENMQIHGRTYSSSWQ